MAAIIDTGVANADRPYIMKMSLVLFLLALIGLTCAITAQYFAAKAAVGCATGLRHALFEHIETLSFTEMDTVGTSTLITRMTSDVNQVAERGEPRSAPVLAFAVYRVWSDGHGIHD